MDFQTSKALQTKYSQWQSSSLKKDFIKFDEEIQQTKERFMKADHPFRFINGVVTEFQKGKECGDESFMILSNLFEITNPFISIEITLCELNKIR